MADTVETLIEQLCSDDITQQIDAFSKLQAMEKLPLEPFMHILESGDGNEMAQSCAILVLEHSGDSGIIPALVTALGNERLSAGARREAQDALKRIGSSVFPHLIPLLNDSKPRQRETTLNMLRTKDAVPALTTALRDPQAQIRASAAELLGRIGEAAAIEPLIAALDDPDAAVRLNVTRALVVLRAETAIEPLIARLGDLDLPVREEVARALGTLKSQRAVEPLIPLLRDSAAPIRAAAAHALGLLQDTRAFEPVMALLLDSDHQVRLAAISALGALRDIRAAPDLIALLLGGDEATSNEAYQALFRIQNERIAELLAPYLPELDAITRAEFLSIFFAQSKNREGLLRLLSQTFASQDDAVWQSVVTEIRRRGREGGLSYNSPSAIPVDDNNAYFTTYYPREIQAKARYGLYVYAHHRGSEHAVFQDVQKFAQELGGKVPNPHIVVNDVIRLELGTALTVVPQCAGVTFNPVSLTKTYSNPWTRFDFDLTSGAVDELLTGTISIQVSGVEIASIKMALEVRAAAAPVAVDNPLAAAKLSKETARMYQRIFVSYSRQDKAVVEAYRLAQLALGNDVFMDTYSIRAGENWQAALAHAIDNAEVFQLFWSENSAQSSNVRDEWDYALRFKCAENRCEEFIRPVYWIQPMPATPPLELNHLNFRYVPLQVGG
jgi:HEAT repeat protein